MRSYEDTTTQSGASLPTAASTAAWDASPNTGTPCRRAISVAAPEVLRTSPTTSNPGSSDSSALAAVGPSPISSTRRISASHRV